MTRRLALAMSVCLALLVPAVAGGHEGPGGQTPGTGKPEGGGKGSPIARAVRACKAELADLGEEGFKQKYATDNLREAKGRCKRAHGVTKPGEQNSQAGKAARACKAEYKQLGEAGFKQKYETDNLREAGARCMRAHGAEPPRSQEKPGGHQRPGGDGAGGDESPFTNAAKQCKAEYAELGEEGFKQKYGANEDRSNAFGQCVRSKVHEGGSGASDHPSGDGEHHSGGDSPPAGDGDHSSGGDSPPATAPA